jgi:Na+/H+-dicarboxylate symporter
MNERVYKTMGSAGAAGIAVGVIVLVSGVVSGILMIVHGARLLAGRKNVLI